MKRSLLLAFKIRSLTQSISRPEEDRNLFFDLNEFSQQDFELAINDSTGLSTDSKKDILQINDFIYLYAPFPIELTIDGLVIPDFQKILMLSAPIAHLSVRNLSTERSVVCSVIYG